MEWGTGIAAGWLLLMNGAAFAAFGIDKRRAVSGRWRIRERTLFLLAALGGSAGALAGMYVFRHKTRHRKFTVGLPAILIFQLGLAAAWAVGDFTQYLY